MFDNSLNKEIDGVYMPSSVTNAVVEDNREYISAAEKTVPCEPVMTNDMEAINIQKIQAKYLDNAIDLEADKLDENVDETSVVIQEKEKEKVHLVQIEIKETTTETDVEFKETERKVLKADETTEEILSTHTQDEVVKREATDEQFSVGQETVKEEEIEVSLTEVIHTTETEVTIQGEIKELQPQKVPEDTFSAEEWEQVQETQETVTPVEREPEEVEEVLDVAKVTDTQIQPAESQKYEPKQTPEELPVQEAVTKVEQQEKVIEQTQMVGNETEAMEELRLVRVRPVDAEEVTDVTTATKIEIVSGIVKVQSVLFFLDTVYMCTPCPGKKEPTVLWT